MQVGMIAVIDLLARAALSTWPRRRVVGQAQQTGGQVEPQCRLADSRRPDQQQRMRRLLGVDGALDGGHRCCLPARPQLAHGFAPVAYSALGSVVAAALVVRRRGLGVTASADTAASAVAAFV